MKGTTLIAQRTSGCVVSGDQVLTKELDGNVEQITADNTLYAAYITIYGIKSFADGVPTNNAANVQVGVADAVSGTEYLLETILPGEGINWHAGVGRKIQLSSLRVKGTALDGVAVLYS